MQDIKMSDVFELPMLCEDGDGCLYSRDLRYTIIFDDTDLNCFEQKKAVAIAIDNHDRLAKEVRMCGIEASSITLWLFDKFFSHKPDMTPIELCDSPSGMLTQIDNMSVGILDDMNSLKAQNEALTKTVDAYMVKVSEQEEEIERLRALVGAEDQGDEWAKINELFNPDHLI